MRCGHDGVACRIPGGSGDDLMMALARKIVSGEEDDAETVEAVFAAAREAEASGEEYLVDDDWELVEVEPETAEVNHHGTGADAGMVVGNGNGRRRSH